MRSTAPDDPPAVRFGRAGGAFTLETDLLLLRPREEVFPFFADAFNLSRITPPLIRFAVLTPAPIEMRRGLRIDYRLRLHGVPVRWQSEITAWEPPLRFVDEQRKGPYRFWVHEHTFEERDGGTLVKDLVRYAVPGGRLVERLFVRPRLRRIFSYRRVELGRVFAEPQGGR
jgi:ligand-binding SRPBCC domain-containing protein